MNISIAVFTIYYCGYKNQFKKGKVMKKKSRFFMVLFTVALMLGSGHLAMATEPNQE